MATAKKLVKVMDAVHPGDTPPTPSGRPVLVTNRPYMIQDPMLTPDEDIAGEEKSSGEAALQPSDIPQGAPRLTTDDKGIVSVPDQPAETPPEPAKKESVPGESPENQKIEPDQVTPSSLGAEQPAHSTAAIKVTPPKHDVSDEAENAQDAESKSESSEAPPAETNKADPSVAKNQEIDRHIMAGTYFLPIGQVRHRRQKAVVITVFILLTAIVVLNVLLDMEVLNLESIPHTSLFN